MHSLASEHLQDLEDLTGPPRQEQEEIVAAALGSLYRGKVLYSLIRYMGLIGSLQLVWKVCVLLRYSNGSLTDSCNVDRILDQFPLSSPSPLPAGAKASTGRTRRCSRKRPATHVR